MKARAADDTLARAKLRASILNYLEGHMSGATTQELERDLGEVALGLGFNVATIRSMCRSMWAQSMLISHEMIDPSLGGHNFGITYRYRLSPDVWLEKVTGCL